MRKWLSRILTTEIPVSQFVPYSHHITDTIISTKNGEYVSVWKIGGRSHQSASQEEVYVWVRELNQLLQGIATAHVSFWSHIIRRRVSEYPDITFKNNFCQTLDTKYRSRFTDYNLMVNDLYLTVVYRPIADTVLSVLAGKEKETYAQKERRQLESIKALEDINRVLKSAMKRYNATLLGTYEKNGHVYSQALEFLSFLINGEHHPLPVCYDRFANYMVVNRPFFSTWGEIGEVRTLTDVRQFGMLEVSDYGDTTEPGQLNILLQSKYEFILTQSFSTLSKHAAKGYLQKHQKHLIDARDVALSQIDQLNTALDQLVSGEFVMGNHHATLTVFGKTTDEVRRYLSAARATLAEVGIVAKLCDLALEAGYWAQLPANWRYRPRPMPITSLNFLSFSSFHNFMSGKPTGNPWGPAVTILKTVSNAPLYFNFHASSLEQNAYGKRVLGNTMIIGKSGTGKTVALSFLLAQAQKFEPTVVAFDKDRGMELSIRAMGGSYLPLRKGKPSGFNPFQIEPTPENLLFLKKWVKQLIATSGAEITHADEQEITDAINTLMLHIDKPLRSLSMFVQSLPNPITGTKGHPTVHSRLLKWCQGGALGWLFDNASDALDLSTHQIYGFDVTEFLEDAEIRMPTIMYLLYRTEAMLDGRRFMYVFDEFWKVLEDEQFEDLAKNKQKTIRKQNGIFVFATQEPTDALSSAIAKTLVQQCATYLFLPNPGADYDDYVKGFKLSDAEFKLLLSLGEESRRFLIKQNDNSTVAELDLTACEEELNLLSGTPDTVHLADDIIAELGEDTPDCWIPVFLEQVKLQRGVA